MNGTTKWTLLAVCLCCGQEGMAQEQSAEKWKPEVGLELIMELQGTHTGNYNWANLLRLGAAMPIAFLPPSRGDRGGLGLSFEIASFSTCMTAEESIGGDLQTFSNLDAGNIPFALSVCNLALTINGYHSLFLGIRNMNEDYFCSPVTSLFTNSSCGIFPTISANYDIANYPLAAVGGHYRYEGSKSSRGSKGSIVFQTSLYNGRGYNRFTGRENVFRFCHKDDGLFGLAEVTYSRRGSSYFVGSTVYWGGSSINIKGVESGSRGVSFTPWAYAEQRIADRLSLIAGYSHAFSTPPSPPRSPRLGGRRPRD